MKNSICLYFALIISVGSAFAQKFDEEKFKNYQATYPEEQAIFLEHFESVDISIQGDSLVVTTTNKKQMLHLGNQSNVYAKDAIHSSSFFQTQSISAKTLVPDKKKYRTVEVTEFKDSYDKSSSVFYDDSQSTNFIYPAIQPGAITELQYTQRIKDPKFLTSFLLQNYLPVVHAKYTIIADKGVNLKLQVLNDKDKQVIQTEESVRNRVKYTFESKNIEKLKYEENSPPIRASALHVISLINNYETNGKVNTVLSSPKDLFNWYSTFIDGLKEGDHENIKAIVDEIVSPEDTELEKVRKVFYWVQNNIKYIAFEDGMRGLIPHSAAYVCDKRYGDCKDMATIVINMLHEAGVEAHFTWIGTRDITYNYSDYPSPMVDNHMIATYINNGKYYFLDATSQYSSYLMPSSMIQGKEALIALSKSEFEIKEVPVLDANANLRKDSSVFRVENGSVIGVGQLDLHGYPKVFNSYNIIKSSKKAEEKFMQGLLQRGSNKFFVTDYSVSNLDNLDQPIGINYSYKIEDYYRTIGSKIYFNMNLDKAMASNLIDDDREQPRTFRFKTENENIATFQLPENYSVNRLPQNKSFSNDVFSFTIDYKQLENTIVLKRNYTIKTIQIEPEQFEDWNEAIKQLSDAYRDVIILENSGA